MLIQSVDLAAVASASVVLDDGVVVDQLDSYGQREGEFIRRLTAPWKDRQPPDILVVEDIPHGVSFGTSSKKASRLQGRIADQLDALGRLDSLLFVPPALWQRHMGVWRMGPKGAKDKAAEYGYHAPDLMDGRYPIPPKGAGDPAKAKARSKVLTSLNKAKTDYVDAFLIAQWAQEIHDDLGTFWVAQTQTYNSI